MFNQLPSPSDKLDVVRKTSEEFPEADEQVQQVQEVLEQPPQLQVKEEPEDFEEFPGILFLEKAYGGNVQEPMETERDELLRRRQWKREIIDELDDTEGTTRSQKVRRLQEPKQEPQDDYTWMQMPKRSRFQLDSSSDEEEDDERPVEPTGAQKVRRLQEPKQEPEDVYTWMQIPRRSRFQLDSSSDEEEDDERPVEPTEPLTAQNLQKPQEHQDLVEYEESHYEHDESETTRESLNLENSDSSGSQVQSGSSSVQEQQEDVPMATKDLAKEQNQAGCSTQPQQPPTVRLLNVKPSKPVPAKTLNLRLANENTVFTTNLCSRMAAEISALGINQGDAAKPVLNRCGGTFSNFLKKPLAWNKCLPARKEQYKTLLAWLGLCSRDKMNVILGIPTVCCEFQDPQNVIVNYQLPIDPPGTAYQPITDEQEGKMKKAFEKVVYPGKEHMDMLVEELGLDAPTIRRQFATMRNRLFRSNI